MDMSYEELAYLVDQYRIQAENERLKNKILERHLHEALKRIEFYKYGKVDDEADAFGNGIVKRDQGEPR